MDRAWGRLLTGFEEAREGEVGAWSWELRQNGVAFDVCWSPRMITGEVDIENTL